MPPRKTTPEALPAKLDPLDDKIHDLVMKRVQLAPASSPAQQAVRLRRLAARHKGDLPLPVLLNLWRELMAAAATPDRVVHVYSAERTGQFRDLARGLFGSQVPMKSHLSATAIVHECTG